MFGEKKFKAIVNDKFNQFFEFCEEDGFFDTWYKNNLNIEGDKRSYTWERAVQLSKMV